VIENKFYAEIIILMKWLKSIHIQRQRTATRIWAAITTQLRHSGTLGAEHKAIFCPSSLFTVHRRGRRITHT